MAHSLYSKFILGYLIFSLVGLIAIATFLSKMTRDYLIQSKADALYDEANGIASSCSTMYQGKQLDSEEVPIWIRALPHYLKAEIWIISRQGTVVMSSLGGSRVQSFIDGFDSISIGSRSYTTGDYYGMFNGSVLNVSAPITGNYNIYGCVPIHLPINEINQSQNGISSTLYITSVVLFGLSLIILPVFMQTVYLLLCKITVDASEYTVSNLDYRANVKTHDEMGYLSDTLNYMSDKLNRMEEHQKNFITNVSHDFHSPLTSIKGYLEAILSGTIPAEMYEKCLSGVISETERLHKLTENILILNSPDTKGYLPKTNFDINHVIEDTAASFKGTYESKNVSFDLTFSDDIQVVLADLRKVQQVIYNLINDAIEFSHHDSTIYIRALGRYERIFVSIKDIGTDVPKNSLRRIWERFHKTNLSRGKDRKGTDLSLSIVKKIIQAHGESIDVVSTEGVGTELVFSLPRSTSLQIMPARPDYPHYWGCLPI